MLIEITDSQGKIHHIKDMKRIEFKDSEDEKIYPGRIYLGGPLGVYLAMKEWFDKDAIRTIEEHDLAIESLSSKRKNI